MYISNGVSDWMIGGHDNMQYIKTIKLVIVDLCVTPAHHA